MQKETVLVVAWILALISMCFVLPSGAYVDYIDFRSLGILWGLMVVMEGLKQNGLFETIGNGLLHKAKRMWQLTAILIFLPFFFSMLITNDVALITFVPFSMYMLVMCKREDLLIPVITFQTIAANLGSMLTPVGNPQNLYLYNVSQMELFDFIKVMLPYTTVTFGLLVVAICTMKDKGQPVDAPAHKQEKTRKRVYARIFIYCLLFIMAILVVAKVIDYTWLVVVVFLAVLIIERRILVSVDYCLLLTFVGFFIFTGNLGKIAFFGRLLKQLVVGREVLTGIVCSQLISNVPATLLLSGFTFDYKALLIGVNLGGLGTLIASMASLISYKQLAHAYNAKKGKYLAYFTVSNVVFLAILVLCYVLF